MTYIEQINSIRSKYNCAGDLIFNTALQIIIELGQCTVLDPAWYDTEMKDIDARHDAAEKENKTLIMTRDFEKAILECAKELAEIKPIDLIMYIQRETWLGSEVGKPDYHRAMQIIRNCLCYMADNYGAYPCESDITLNDFRAIDLTDEEIEYFGWGYLLDIEEEE